MRTEHVVFLSVAGLRSQDVSAAVTPTLDRWAGGGAMAELVPTFPCVTSCVQATFWTGRPPGKHGVIANGFYQRDRREVEFWVGRSDVIAGEQIWDTLGRAGAGRTSAVWHAQNIKGCSADFIVTPAPIHEPDGTTKLWCYSKPDTLYHELLDALGHFPLQHYWGPLSNIESTRWILTAAAWLHERHTPNFHWIYIPHLDYAAQKFGPNSPQASVALGELDAELAGFEARLSAAGGTAPVFVVAGEYALTDVSGVVYPNRALREAGLLAVRAQGGAEFVDLERCDAFAMVDHQLAHVYVSDASRCTRVASLLAALPGVARVYAGPDRQAVGMDHPRAGDIVAIAEESHWFAYYWWVDDAKAPAFTRTVDIHQKPGYDPVELFFDPATKSIPLDAGLVKGSHGVPATAGHHRTALICSDGHGPIEMGRRYRDVDVKDMTQRFLGVG